MITRCIVRPLRRLVQALSIVLLVLLPLLALYSHYKQARSIGDLPTEQWRNLALRGIDHVVGDSPQRKKLVDKTQGTFWSARIVGFSLTDPLAGAEAIVSSRSFYRPLLWSLLVPVAASVLLGRVFCGWICPINTLLELVDKCRGLLRVAEIRQRDVQFSLKNKYLMLGIALGFVAITGLPLLAMIYPPALLSREMHLFVFGSGVGIGIYLILAICAFELFVSKRWWCRYVCPGGALYSLLGRFRLVRVRRDEQKCIECGDCVRACQFGLRPMLLQTTGMECTNCATCISHCDSNALRYSLVLPIGPTHRAKRNGTAIAEPVTTSLPLAGSSRSGSETTSPPTASRCEESSSTGKVTVGALCLCLLLSQTLHAHHILGLPHYSYKENYPQVPTLEYPATTGPYDVLMTSYPGKPVPGEAAMIAFYIKDRNTGRPYDKPVTVRVLKTSTFGSNEVIHEPATREPFDNQHKYTVTFPSDGEYVTELTMDVEGQTEVIPFLMVAGNPTATYSIVIAVVIGLALFVLVVRAIKLKRDRRKRNVEQVERNLVHLGATGTERYFRST